MPMQVLYAQRIIEQLAPRGRTLATAESCTGGLIAGTLTDVAGASSVFVGGVVAYTNTIKERLLGVPSDALAQDGAVSEAVARAMAAGARKRLGATYAVAVTGIAGPGGGTEEKPVGLVYIAVACPEDVTVHRHQFAGDRGAVRRQTVDAALQHVWETVV
ncbi:MAG: CinA family protein [Candidatus Hydrogenedentota bacterium]